MITFPEEAMSKYCAQRKSRKSGELDLQAQLSGGCARLRQSFWSRGGALEVRFAWRLLRSWASAHRGGSRRA